MAAGDPIALTVAVTVQPDPNEYVITVVPTDTPVTIPLNDPITATPGTVLIHVPPGTPSPNGNVAPTHTGNTPVIAVGVGLTDIVSATWQPPAAVYVMIVVPSMTPVTTPPPEVTVATDVLLLNHVPPVTASPSDAVVPTHSAEAPLTRDGDA
jgi:hypothetical protein